MLTIPLRILLLCWAAWLAYDWCTAGWGQCRSCLVTSRFCHCHLLSLSTWLCARPGLPGSAALVPSLLRSMRCRTLSTHKHLGAVSLHRHHWRRFFPLNRPFNAFELKNKPSFAQRHQTWFCSQNGSTCATLDLIKHAKSSQYFA